MRSDLHTMEKIDQYLTGKLSGGELNQFESELASNPELQNLVSDQQLLIQTVNRKALLAEIHAVAGVGGAPWYANPWLAVSGVIVVAGTIAGVIYYAGDEPEITENAITITNEESVADSTLSETINYNELVYEDSVSERISTDPKTENTIAKEERKIPAGSYPEVCDEVEDDYTDDNTHSVSVDEKVKSVVQTDIKDSRNRNRKATYPKGNIAMREFIEKNMRFPGTAREKKLSGNVKVKFLVTESGERTEIDANCFAMRDENDKPLSSTQFVFNQKIAHLFEKESARIVRIMPAWTPATDSNGNRVLTAVEIYFNFSLKDGISVYRLDD